MLSILRYIFRPHQEVPTVSAELRMRRAAAADSARRRLEAAGLLDIELEAQREIREHVARRGAREAA